MPTKEERIGLQDTSLAGVTIRGAYDSLVALKILEAIAAGETLKEICDLPDMPTTRTIHRWVNLHPEFQRAFNAARELSAMAFEEQALRLAKKLYSDQSFTGTIVRAYEVAMAQLRWSAARRDPKRYGQQGNATLVVPIQINTSLDMGADTAGSTHTPEHPDIYQIEARVIAGEPEGPLTADPMAAPEEVTYAVGREDARGIRGPRKKPPGRPKKRHLRPPSDPDLDVSGEMDSA